ncbi:hypothetical protein BGZ96_001607 [Linnemannia gamsii]|uniref:BZIP domain-containing protein n=1 Tax=Linnemannia gamsii TaxID=64522 RepID=A0ABQ7JM83_9FUNG|nr:hypothetical protein BGZ96_001607 [Linnemannia gamsii]
MMAHASSADAPFDSEVSTADLDSEAFATTPSATHPLSTTTPTALTTAEASLQFDILAQLMDTSSTLSSNSQNNSTSSSTSWTASPSISPMVLKLESPLLSHLEVPTSTKRSTRRTSTSSTTTTTTTNSSRKRSAQDPVDKEAKARERVLRNRAAAQESRDKKRKYVSEIETSNETLQQENCQLLKRLKTVESDNLSLHQRLEALTAQFAQMQQQLASSSQSVKHNNTNQPGVGFCQSAVLAKKDRKSRETDNLTNSPQQKLAPTQRNPHTTISTNNKHRQVYSMTMKTLMTSKQSPNREARSLSDQSAAQQKWTEISCRPSCNNNHNCRRKKALTLSSSAAASFPTTPTPSATVPAAAYMMVFLANMLLPQLMLNFSTLFLISTGAQSSNPQQLPPPLPQQEQELRQAILTFIQQRQRLFSSHLLSNSPTVAPQGLLLPQSRTIKDDITSLHPSVIEEIVTEFRQGRKQAARGLLVRALVSSRLTLDSNEICKRLSLLRKK